MPRTNQPNLIGVIVFSPVYTSKEHLVQQRDDYLPLLITYQCWEKMGILKSGCRRCGRLDTRQKAAKFIQNRLDQGPLLPCLPCHICAPSDIVMLVLTIFFKGCQPTEMGGLFHTKNCSLVQWHRCFPAIPTCLSHFFLENLRTILFSNKNTLSSAFYLFPNH